MATIVRSEPRVRVGRGELRPVRALGRWAAGGVRRAAGAATLLAGLAVCFSIPVAQFLAFGYMLRSAGGVASTGRIGEALAGWRTAARLGAFLAAAWLCTLPAQVLASFAADAELVSPGSVGANRLRTASVAAGVFTVFHVGAAALYDLRWTRLFRPLSNLLWLARGVPRGSWYAERARAALAGWRRLHLFELVSLGVRGYLGTAMWLAAPSFFLLAGLDEPAMGVIGVCMLTWTASLLPVVQIRFAAEDRFGAFFEVGAARALRARAPAATFLATLAWLALSLVVYLSLVEEFPSGLEWIPSLAFVVAALPPRWMMGWAAARAASRDLPAGPWLRWPFWWLTLAVCLAFAATAFYMPHASFRGSWIHWDQPAFLFPIWR
jgi:hypothetical protein